MNQKLRPSPTALLNPRCDPIFKALFTQGTEDSNTALKSFISAALGRNVEEVSLQPNEPPVDIPEQMQMSFDVSARFDDGELASIEMQGRSYDYDFGTRSEIQVARLLNVINKKGGAWSVPKVYQISVLNFEYDKDDNSSVSWYTMRKKSGKGLGDRMNVIYLNLVKLRERAGTPVEELTSIERWGMYFALADDKKQSNYISKIVKSEKGLMAADSTVKYMSEEEANWFRQNSYDIAMRDYNAAMEAAVTNGLQKGLQQGLQQGLEEGLQQGVLETAKKLLQMNVMTLEQIAEATGLTPKKVKELAEE